MKHSLEVSDLLKTIRDAPITDFKKGCAGGHLMASIANVLDMGIGAIAFQIVFPSIRAAVIDLLESEKNAESIDELIALQEGIMTGKIVVEP